MENRKRDMLDAEAAYCAMEEDLQEIIDFIEITYPDYDHYEYDLDEIGHDPYQLAAYLTVQFEDYTRSEVSLLCVPSLIVSMS